MGRSKSIQIQQIVHVFVETDKSDVNVHYKGKARKVSSSSMQVM